MDERHRLAVIVDRIIKRRLDEPLRTFERYRLDADRGRLRKAYLLHTHLADEERLHLLNFRRAVHPLDTGIDVFGILAENHHVGEFGTLHRARHALEVAHRSEAHVEIELLTHRHVDGTDSAADRSRERSLDRDETFAADVKRLLRQPLASRVERLFAREHFAPCDLALPAVRLFNRGIPNDHRGLGNVRTRAVAFNERNLRIFGNAELPAVHSYLFAHISSYYSINYLLSPRA